MTTPSETSKIRSKKEKTNRNQHNYGKKCRKTPKKITPTYLHNAGLYYLERFAASKAHFKDVMIRKVKRSCMAHKEQNYETCEKMVNELADKFEACGLLNDKVYASALVAGMRRKGLSRRAINAKMQHKGIVNEQAKKALETLDLQSHETYDDAEFSAALTLARKKKIGPYFVGEEQNIQKSLGIFARAGYSYDVAQRIAHMSSDDLEELLD